MGTKYNVGDENFSSQKQEKRRKIVKDVLLNSKKLGWVDKAAKNPLVKAGAIAGKATLGQYGVMSAIGDIIKEVGKKNKKK